MNKKITKTNCLNIQYELLNGLYFSNKLDTEEFLLCFSSIIDDCFWNIAYVKNELDLDKLKELETEFGKIDRTSTLYIGRDNKNYSANKKFLLENGYKLNDTDAYLVLNNPNKQEITTTIKIIENEEEYNDFMGVLDSAYGGEKTDENVYAGSITKPYYEVIRQTINSDRFYHIIAYDKRIPVSCATVSVKNGIYGVNNVGTAQGHWNKGYGKQIMTFIINKFERENGNILILSTEYESKNQRFYEKIGFKVKYVMEQYVKE